MNVGPTAPQIAAGPSAAEKREPIAIVGIGCRFPGGASSPATFWQLLLDGVDAVGEIPEDRWDVDAFYHPDPQRPGKIYTRRGSFLHGVDLFDSEFFHISPREAASMDPQQRLLLELAWEALEDGGQVPGRLAGRDVGVFMGVCNADYTELRRPDVESIDSYTNAGGALSIVANRISHAFDFRGPSLAIDTACSSSLVAVHLATESLSRGESALALAGGVNLMFNPGLSVGFARASMLSPRGECSSFAAQADGYVRAEGAGVVVLKPLATALADGDPVYAVIRATAVNQDGRTNGISLPSADAQEALLRHVYARAGIAPQAVQYVEAHGTGTPVGDPIECAALGRALGAGRAPGDELRIGSVKTNIGHAEAASGIAGLIKTALALRHGRIPASLHCATPNPAIPFADLRLTVQRTLAPWPDGALPAIAGVNSFGFGGTSAHVVLAEYAAAAAVRQAAVAQHDAAPRLLPISARSPEALRTNASAHVDLLDTTPSLDDACHTAGARREHHPYRLAVAGRTTHEMRESLQAFLTDDRRPGLAQAERPATQRPRLAFVFSGNGSQWPAMGSQLLASEPVFRDAVAACDALFHTATGWSIADELRTGSVERMARTDVAQPALLAVQLGLVALWRSWGIEPDAVMGHSVGEVAAAHVAGILTLEDTVDVMLHRSRQQQRTAGSGAMAAIGLPPADVVSALAPYDEALCVAAVNSPRSVTVSGDRAAVRDLVRSLAAAGVFARELPLDYAFHSKHMSPIQADLLAALADLRPRAASLPFVSTVTGYELAGPELDAEYWWDNIRQPVDFAAAVGELTSTGDTVFVEIGPHPVLAHYVGECLAAAESAGSVLASLRRNEDEAMTMAGTLGALYTLGVTPAWTTVNPPGRHVRLPAYPWQRQRHWQEVRALGRPISGSRAHPLLGHRIDTAQTCYESQPDPALLPYLADHKVGGAVVFPAAGYLEMALAVADGVEGATDDGTLVLTEFELRRPLLLPLEARPPVVHVTRSAEDGQLRIHSRDGDRADDWVLHAIGRAARARRTANAGRIDLAAIRDRCPRELPADVLYARADQHGVQYGPRFRALDRVWGGADEALGEVRPPMAVEAASDSYLFHPVALDACFQTVLTCILSARDGEGHRAYLPLRVDRLSLHRRPSGSLLCHVRVVDRGPSYLHADLTIVAADGEIVAELAGFRLRAVDLGQAASSRRAHDHVYEERWVPKRRLGAGTRRSATGLPSPRLLADLDQVLPDHARRSAELERPRHYRETIAQLDALSTAYIGTALASLGWRPRAGERVGVASLREQLGIDPAQERLLGYLLGMLEQDGVLTRAGDEWKVRRQPDEVDPAPLWAQVMAGHPGYLAELILLGRCGTRLAEVLTGRADPLEILFGDKASATLEHFYESGATLRMCNALVEGVVTRIVAELPAGRSLRVLEIGAGTGGTTTRLLPLLPADRTEYVFSDVSEAFLRTAEQRCRDFPFVTYQTLDIEHDPIGQGFGEHTFDLIIASNVLHATRDLRRTLGNVRRLLASDGLLTLAEITNPTRPLFLIFGLLRGFWLFSDTDLRPDHALLPAQRWLDVLAQVGFQDPAVLAEPEPTAEVSVLLARGPRIEANVARPADSRPRTWLVFADAGGAAEQVAGRLRSGGDRVVLAKRGEGYQQAAGSFVLRPGSAADLAEMFAALRRQQVAVSDIVHAWSLDAADPQLSASTLAAGQKAGCLSTLHVVQQLAGDDSTDPPRLWLVTGGAVPLRPGEHRVSVAQSPLVGLRRVIFNEHPELRCTLVDLSPPEFVAGSPQYRADDLAQLCDELWSDEDEDEVMLRGQERFVNRVERAPVATGPTSPTGGTTTAGGGNYRLAVATPGTLRSLCARPAPRPAPGPGQVEIEVETSALNFRDVMFAMGLLPPEVIEVGYRLSLGSEAAGRITRIGEGVSDFHVGDEVIAIGRGHFSPYMLAERDFVVPKPAHIGFEAAATMLAAYCTSHYALRTLGRLRAGERVLIHHGTGAVGLAAIQIAQAVGAEVFATAGSPEKREYLRLLGVPHVMDSRSLAFGDEIMRSTGGEGVHVVLNSVSGDGLRESLRVLGRFGRFLELGKHDFMSNSQLGLRPFERCLSLHAIDLNQLLLDRPLVRAQLAEIGALIDAGVYRPLPYRVFPIRQAAAAFRQMQQARHIGKLVISMRDGRPPTLAPPPDDASASGGLFAARPDGTYVITGGLGGFGLAAARWLVERGARHLVLAGRRGAATPAAAAAVEELREAGAEVLVAAADVSDAAQLREMLDSARAAMPPIRGVLHAAMALDDGLVRNLDDARFATAIGPKVLGAWHLHEQTLADPLDLFVLFSSFTSVTGNAGQANYVAGNAFLDGFAAARRHQGLPALTINWGGIAEVGYVAQLGEGAARLFRKGIRAMDPLLALDTMGQLLEEGRVRAVVADIDWTQAAGLWQADTQRAAHLFEVDEGGASAGGDEDRVLRAVLAADDDQPAAVTTWLADRLGRVLGCAATAIDPDRSLVEVGLDSLMAMELHIRVQQDLGVDVPVLELMQARSLSNVAANVVEALRARPPQRARPQLGSAA